MTDKSGIEMLEEILHRLDILDKRLNVMDQNIKAIANSAKISELVTKLAGTPLDNWSRVNKPKVSDVKEKIAAVKEGFANFKFESADAAKSNVDKVLAEKKRLKPTQIMVRGKMVANLAGNQPLPLSNISVKIYNAKDELVKETKTNRAGQWLSQLAPGEYVALFEGELHGKKLVPQNRNFVVPKTLPPSEQYFEVI